MFRKGSVCEPRRQCCRHGARDSSVLPFPASPGGQLGRMINILASLFFLLSYNTRAM